MLKDTIITILGRSILLLCNVLATIFTARFLGPEGRGVYSLLTNYATIISIVGNLGIGTGNTYFSSQQRYHSSTLGWNSIIGGLLVGIFFIPIGWLVPFIFPKTLQSIPFSLLWITLMAVPALLIGQFLNALALGIQQIIIYNIVFALPGVVLALGLFVALSLSPRVDLALTVFTFAYYAMAIAGYFVLLRVRAIGLHPKLNLNTFKATISFGIILQLGNFFQFLLFRLPLFFINTWVDTHAAGLYSISVYLAESLWQITQSIGVVLLPRVSATPKSDDVLALTSKSSRLGLAASTLIALAMAVCAYQIMHWLFGTEFLAATPALLLLLPGTVAFSLTNVLGNYLTGRGFPHYNTIVFGIALTLCVGLNLCFIPYWGITGAAMAVSLSYLASALVTFYFFRKLAGDSEHALAVLPHIEDWKTLFQSGINVMRKITEFLKGQRHE